MPATPTGAPGATALAARSGSTPSPATAAPRRSRRSAAAPSAATIASARRRCSAWPSASATRTIRWRRPAPAAAPPASMSASMACTTAQRLLRQRRAGLQPLRRQRHAPHRRHRHDRDGEILGHRQPARRPRRSRPAVRVQARSSARSFAVTPFAALQPAQLWTPGDRRIERHRRAAARRLRAQLPAAEHDLAADVPGRPVRRRDRDQRRGRSRPGCARPGCTSS